MPNIGFHRTNIQGLIIGTIFSNTARNCRSLYGIPYCSTSPVGLDIVGIQGIKTGLAVDSLDESLLRVQAGHGWTAGLAILIRSCMPNDCMDIVSISDGIFERL